MGEYGNWCPGRHIIITTEILRCYEYILRRLLELQHTDILLLFSVVVVAAAAAGIILT